MARATQLLLVFFCVLGYLVTISYALSSSQYPDTDIVIITNNDLDATNPNRAGALYLKTAFTCSQAHEACTQLDESLLPKPTNTGFTTANLTSVLMSDRHGVAIDSTQQVWIAGESQHDCSVFVPAESYTLYSAQTTAKVDYTERLPVLCTNSAPLTRSNVTSYDTTRQIKLATNKAGILTGFRDKFTWRFLGIQFAETTAGAARFQPPVAYDVSSETERSALDYGVDCPQPPDADNGHLLYTDEDCLTLNVYTPVVKTGTPGQATGYAPRLPVMFFIHGGGLNTGGPGPFPYNYTTSGFVGNSISNIYDGTNLVSYGGVVLVTISYRLTALGWFNASNAALKDALLALHWVQDNIENFGGDPSKVLIYGESAGGTMTRYLLGTNPAYTQGLFSAAVLESDFATSNPFFSPYYALNTSLTLAQYLGCAPNSTTTWEEEYAYCVRALPAGDVVMASYDLGLTWDITVDGDYVLNDITNSIADGLYGRVPTIFSTNECEYCYFLSSTILPNSSASIFPDSLGLYFNSTAAALILNQTLLYPYETAPAEDGISGAVLTLGQLMTDWYVHCPNVYEASLETNTTNPGNSYKILFGQGLGSPLTPNPELCPGQVCHADELYFVFATAETDNLYQPLTSYQLEITRDIINRWTSLVWTGNPNYQGATLAWPPYTGDNEFVVNVTNSIQPYRVAQCDFIQSQLGLVYGEGTF